MTMRILLLIILLMHPLFSALLLNENIYERANRIDLMLSFDTPFKGNIKKHIDQSGRINIVLTRTEIQKPFYKSIRKSFVDSVAVTKSGGNSALIKITPNNSRIGVQASKTVDGFGLRLRIYPLKTEASDKPKTEPLPAVLSKFQKREAASKPSTHKEAVKPLNTLKSSDTLPGWRYWSVLAILLLLLLILWLAKRKGLRNLAKGGGWLLPKGAIPANLPEEAVIRFQKPIDTHNRVILIEFAGRQYLMVVGNTNTLLDTFTEGRIEEEDDFTRMFEANKKQLDHFLKENHPDAYEAFKANASKEEHL